MLCIKVAIVSMLLLALATAASEKLNAGPVVDFSTCALPEWPKASVRNNEDGTVNLRFLIGPDGRVVDVKVWKTSGFRAIDKAAIKAISACHFKPAILNGKPVDTWRHVEYEWQGHPDD